MLTDDRLPVPWAAIYRIEEENGRASMVASVGFLDAKVNVEAGFAEVIRTRQPLAVMLEPAETGGGAAGDAAPVHARRVVISPVGAHRNVTGFVVVGLASNATFDDDARSSLDVVARAEGALRDSEERLRLVVESAKDFAIFTMGLDGLIESWNVGAERMFGWTQAEALGQHARMIFTPDDRKKGAAEAEMRQAAQCGRAEDERWHLKRNGDRFYASGVLVPLRPDGILTGYAKIARDLTERKQLEDALLRAQDELEERVGDRTAELARANSELAAEVQDRRAAEAHVKALFRRLVTVQEEERRRIARDLHDQLGQPMTVLRMELDALESRSADSMSFTAQAARMRGIAEELDRNIDFLTWDLRPAALDHLGLAAALAKLVNGWSERFGIAAEFGASWPERCRLAPEAEANLYRLTQEALHNIAKHAASQHVSVLLERRADQAVLIIEDDGRGFVVDHVSTEPARGGLGLVSMRERATLVGGEFHIESAPGQGTSIYVRIPMAREEHEA
jgi:PAS domain S-box-containing protein